MRKTEYKKIFGQNPSSSLNLARSPEELRLEYLPERLPVLLPARAADGALAKLVPVRQNRFPLFFKTFKI